MYCFEYDICFELFRRELSVFAVEEHNSTANVVHDLSSSHYKLYMYCDVASL